MQQTWEVNVIILERRAAGAMHGMAVGERSCDC